MEQRPVRRYEKLPILKRIGAFFLDFIETIVIALVIFVIVYQFLFQPHQVKGQSMFDNFHDGEYLLTDKITYRFNLPKVGDIVVFKAPNNEDYDYIKRIIGLPGDSVMVKGGQVYLNGKLFDESGYLNASVITRSGSYAREGVAITVPPKTYFTMGDNRPNSSDSREWGTVPEANIVGRSWIRYWPINRTGVIDKYPKASL